MIDSLLRTAAVAELLDTSADWVRDHAAELGGIRLGQAKNGELRFERRRVQAYLDRQRLSVVDETAEKGRPGRRQGSKGDDVELIELPGWAA